MDCQINFKNSLDRLGIFSAQERINQLPVISVFHTIDGEGYHIGTPSVFVRLAGCAVGCLTCDTMSSWRVYINSLLELPEIVDRVVSCLNGSTRVVITGGEPMHYPAQLITLVQMLHDTGVKVVLETSGTIIHDVTFDMFDSVSLDVKTPSSGISLNACVLDAIIKLAKRKNVFVKAVIRDKEDLDWCKKYINPLLNRHDQNPLVLTPCLCSAGLVSTTELLSMIKTLMRWDLGYNIRVITQQHKIIGFP